MVSHCGRYAIAYNGEIYNFPEIRTELLARNVPLRTESDTEVLLELFALEGIEALKRLVGMFAVAIWDDREGALFLARDSYGIKPLYYADDGWTLRAASQVKALLAGGAVSRDPDPAGVVGFLLWGNVPEPFTLYQQIRAVPPGHVVRVDANGAHAALPFLSLAELYSSNEDAAPDQRVVYDSVLASVQRHLIADVPVGLFLSSGVDSTALLAAIHAIDPDRVAHTTVVTLGFSEYVGSPRDEVPLAAEVAKVYGARHVVRRVNEPEFVSDLPNILESMDQPSVDGVNSWFVSKAAADVGLKVVLSGVGGDELFAGYTSFRTIPRWRALLAGPSRVPGASTAWERIARRLSQVGRVHPKLTGLLRHGRGWAGVYLLARGLYLPHELQAVLDRDIVERGLQRLVQHDPVGQIVSAAPAAATSRVSMMESALYMRNQLLRDIDWASMAHSLEVRTPFVDVELLRRIRPLQARLKGKDILADSFGVPDQIRNRPKTGFSIPISAWIQNRFVNEETEGVQWARSWARLVMNRAMSRNPGAEGGS